MKLVSVIIPCYNYGWLLPETLDSLLAQTYPHWEAILVDDGSVDNTRSIGEAYQQRDGRFRYLYQANQGMSAARNRGLAAATGEYIQFLDADDLLAPQKFALQAAFLDANPAVDLVYGSMRYFRHGNPTVLSRSADMQDRPWMAESQGEGKELINILVEKSIMVVNAPLLRASLVRKVGPFSENLRSVEDWEFWIRCALVGARFRYDDASGAWAIVRVHPTSTSHNLLGMHKYEVQMRHQLRELLIQNGAPEAVEINDKAIDANQVHLARHNLISGDLTAGIKGFARLAYRTGEYSYYLKNLLYWLKHRLVAPVKK